MMHSKKLKLFDHFISYTLSPLLSLLAIILLIPFYLFISLLVLMCDGKPILFKSQRAGYLGKSFTLYMG